MDLSAVSGSAEEVSGASVTRPPNIFEEFLEGLRAELVTESMVEREGAGMGDGEREGEGEEEEGGESVARGEEGGDVREQQRMEDDVMGEGGGDGRGVKTQSGEPEVSSNTGEMGRCGLGDSSDEALELRDIPPMLQQYLVSLTGHSPPLDK